MGSIKYNGTAINEIQYGGTEIKKVYYGPTLIWQKGNSISISNYDASRTAANGYIDVTVTADIAWTASITSGSDWVSISTNSGSAGSTSFRVTYTENTSIYNTRTGTIRFIAGDSSIDMNFIQAKAQPKFSISESSATFSYDGFYGNQSYFEPSIDTNANLSDIRVISLVYDDDSSQNWINYDSSSRRITVDAVTTIRTQTARTGTIVLGIIIDGNTYSDTIGITQNLPTDQSSLSVYMSDGSTISGQLIVFDYNEGTKYIKAIATDGWGAPNTYTVSYPISPKISGLYIRKSGDTTWRQSTISDIPSDTVVEIKVSNTSNYYNYQDELIISSGSHSYTLTVEQDGRSAYYSASSSSTVGYTNGSKGYIYITTNPDMSWTIDSSDHSSYISNRTPVSGTGNGTVAATFYAATTYSSRSTTFTVTFDTGVTKTAILTQSGIPYLTVDTTSINSAYTESTYYITVTSNTSWTVSRSHSWITLSGGSSGNGSKQYAVTIAANSSTSSRSGSITFSADGCASQTVSITQNAQPYLTVSPTSINNVAYSGGTYTIDVQSNTNWSVTSSSWITLTSGTTGSGNSSYEIEVRGYDEVDDRTGVVTFYQTADTSISRSVTVKQNGAPAWLNVDTTTITGSTANRDVYSNASWTATPSVNWITVNPSSGTKNNSVEIKVTAATGPGQDTSGNVVFKIGNTTYATIPVTRSSIAYSISTNPTNRSIDYNSGSGSFTVDCNDGNNWAIGHITHNASATKTNSTTVTYSYPTYDSDNADTDGYVRYLIPVYCTNDTTKTATFTIVQTAPSISLSSNSLNMDNTAYSLTNQIKVTSSGTWSASSNKNWLSVTATGSSGAYPTFTTTANTGDARSATVTFTCGSASTSLIVTQAAGSNLSLNYSTASVNAKGDSYDTIRVTYNYAVTASSDKSWLHVTTPSGTSGTNNILSYSCDENTSTSSRTGVITLVSGGKTVTLTVTQAKAIQLNVNVTTVYEGKSAGTCTAIILASSNSDITVTSDYSWLTITTVMPLAGDGTDKQIDYSYTINPNTTSRTAVLTFTSGTGSDKKTMTVSVVQSGEGSIKLTDTSNNQVVSGAITFAYTGGTKTYRVETNPGNWTVSTDTSWLTVAKDSSDTSLLNVTCGRYALGRQGSFTITAGNNVKTVTITVNQTERDVIG